MLTISGNQLQFKPKFNRDTIAQLKFLGMRWSPARKLWYKKITKIFLENFLGVFPEFYNDLKDYLPAFLPQIQWTPSEYLMEHQEKGAALAVGMPRFCFFDDIGTGKTVLGIELFKQKQVKTLVVCPLSIIEDVWREDIQNFMPGTIAANLWQAKRSKNLDLALKWDFCIINFESFRIEAKNLAKAGFQMLIIDESAYCKDARSQITKALVEFSENMDYVYEMSGNPAPNSEMEYFSQAKMVNPMLFGNSFYSFRNRYFYPDGYGGFKWKMKEEMREDFLEKLSSISRVVLKEDVLDLPERTFNVRRVYLDTVERKTYETMKRDLVVEFAGMEIVAANAAVKQMKLREGTSGFYLDEDSQVVKVGESKLKELKKLLEEIGNHQVIIWTHFHYEADMVEKLLGGGYGRIDGTIKNQVTKDENARLFRKGKFQYLIAHPGSKKYGSPFVNCTYVIYFSLSHSWDAFKQSAGRNYRKGQTNKCSYYFLIADCSVDEIIWKALQEKKSVSEAVFAYIKGRR